MNPTYAKKMFFSLLILCFTNVAFATHVYMKNDSNARLYVKCFGDCCKKQADITGVDIYEQSGRTIGWVNERAIYGTCYFSFAENPGYNRYCKFHISTGNDTVTIKPDCDGFKGEGGHGTVNDNITIKMNEIKMN